MKNETVIHFEDIVKGMLIYEKQGIHCMVWTIAEKNISLDIGLDLLKSLREWGFEVTSEYSCGELIFDLSWSPNPALLDIYVRTR